MKVLITGGSGFIGTNLTQALHGQGITFKNLDIVPPKDIRLAANYSYCDLLNLDQVMKEFELFQPTIVVHLAAQTDTDPKWRLEDYALNIIGTENLIASILATKSVERYIHTSTQFVHQMEGGPKHDEDYAPHTIYGESKVLNEKKIRSTDFKCSWTIIRPTNIWGPWHLRYPFEFWKILAEGKYLHPGKQRVMRSYGYVGNVVHQIRQIMNLPVDQVDHQTFYVGDRPIDLFDWVNGFSIRQTGKRVVVMPRVVLYGLALAGDLLRVAGIKFPITTSRYKSMTTDNPVDMKKTFDVLGENRFTLEQGIEETVSWMRVHHPSLIKQ
ncbi:MAG TPA: NAD(P)-dependent oxidoreductase [Cyclobacteriaceae bacterium]|nr:NAD(P)-dependent oxidoreductase [Cyclobacteriaceae bacterium]